jgi:hypothetical protein
MNRYLNQLKEMSVQTRSYLNNVLRVLSRLANTLIGGYPTETISGRAWRDGWWITKWVLDSFWGFFGDKDHCYNSWLIDSQHLDKRP